MDATYGQSGISQGVGKPWYGVRNPSDAAVIAARVRKLSDAVVIAAVIISTEVAAAGSVLSLS